MDKYIGLGIFVFCVVLTVILSPRIGVSWDEPDNIWAAGVYIKFFQSGMNPSILIDKNSSASYFHEKIFTQEPSLYRYPPVPLFVGAGITLAWERVAGRPLSPLEIITAFHIASGVFWAMLAATAYGFARFCVSSRIVALLVSLLVAFHPLLFGHGVSVIKDSAQASLFALSLFLLVKATETNKIIFLIIGALVWGSAMATKMNAVYVPIIWGSWRIIQWLSLFRQGKRSRDRIIKEFFFIARDSGILIIGGGMVMVLFWPYLWYDPLSRFQEVIRYFTYVGAGYKVFWDGLLYSVGSGISLPWYPVVHLLIATPIPILGLLGFSFITLGIRLLKRQLTNQSILILIFLWISIPLLRVFSPRAAFYDGMRHFLEIIPPFILLSSLGIEQGGRMLGRILGTVQYGYLLIWLGFVSYIGILHVFLFPYGAGYVNALIRYPNTTVERDFLGLSVAEAVKRSHALWNGPKRVYVPIGGHLSWYYLRQNDQYVYNLYDSDVVVLINKPSHVQKKAFTGDILGAFEEVGLIQRGTNEFAWIYRRKR